MNRTVSAPKATGSAPGRTVPAPAC